MKIIKLASDEAKALYTRYEADVRERMIQDEIEEPLDAGLVLFGLNRLIELFLWFKDPECEDPDLDASANEYLENEPAELLTHVDVQTYVSLIYDLVPPALSKQLTDLSKVIILDERGDYILVFGEVDTEARSLVALLTNDKRYLTRK